jgi:hypothetical protein
MANPLSQLDEAGDAVRKVIRAYHGSPYDFDRFDASKIGTGEGHQAYGRGLYFAGSEDVADTYRRSVSALQRTPKEDALEFWRRHVERTDNPRNAVQYAIDDAEESMQEAAGIPQAEQRWREIVRHLYELDYRQPVPKRPGNMYEVEIGVPEDRLLDHDRPFSTPVGAVGAEVLRQHNPAAIGQRGLRAIQDGSWRFELHRGRSPYETAAVELTRLANTKGGAQALTDAGIPGIRYLDQGSRSAGQGSRNYVMFPGTEDSIRILRKYGMLAPIAAGATADE